jgi:hypothetical protein
VAIANMPADRIVLWAIILIGDGEIDALIGRKGIMKAPKAIITASIALDS